MNLARVTRALLLVLVGVIAAPRAAEAQYLNRSAPPDGYDYGEPAGGADRDSGLSTRVDRLERELRKATGQIEELQHQVQVLEDQLRARPEATALPPPVAGRAPSTLRRARRLRLRRQSFGYERPPAARADDSLGPADVG